MNFTKWKKNRLQSVFQVSTYNLKSGESSERRKELTMLGDALLFDRSFVDQTELQAIDFMFENELIELEENNQLGTSRYVFNSDKLGDLEPEKIKQLQRYLQSDGTYPEGEGWIDGDVKSGTRTIEGAQSTFNTNILAYMDLVHSTGNRIDSIEPQQTPPRQR